jgi:hypothetical protein
MTEEMRSDVERDDDRERTAEDAAAERALHEHPARPEQPGEGFAEGYEHVPETPEEELEEEREPNFARGISHEDPPGTEHHGRFSEGQEELPETPDKTVERRFSEGIEESPTSE